MTERLIISVDDIKLRVQDVFGHVLDLFELLANRGQPDDDAVTWKLVKVSMNSPLFIEAEAIPNRPNVSVDQVARQQKRDLLQNLSELRNGRVPSGWRPAASEQRRSARPFRSARPAMTTIQVDESETVVFTADDVAKVAETIAAANAESLPRPREQRGSLEGRLLDVGTYHGTPAISLSERKTGLQVWCQVPDRLREAVAKNATFEDVWKGARVSVRGTIFYDRVGKISRMQADELRLVADSTASEQQIADPSFTGGLDAATYLDKLREGTLG